MTILKTIKYRKLEITVLLALVFEFIFPHYSLAAMVTAEPNSSMILPNLVLKNYPSEEQQKVSLPHLIKEDQDTAVTEPAAQSASDSTALPTDENKVVKIYTLTITAYSSTVDQCDGTPCITANGFDLCAHNQEDVIAANFLPFGTRVRIPEYFGDRIFTVQDSMNARYYHRADVWLKSRQAAQEFGLVYTTLEVLE